MLFSHKIDTVASKHRACGLCGSAELDCDEAVAAPECGKISGGQTGRKPMSLRSAQQLRDFVLHGFQFVQAQLRVRHNKDIAS